MASGKLTPQTVLRRVPNLTVRIESDNQVHILWNGKEIRFGPRALSVLDVFSQPQSFAEASEHLQTLSKGAQDWMDLTTSLLQLHQVGILQEDLGPHLAPASSGFDSARIHVLMLNDRDRTARFLRGIRETVRTGDIVLDLGTGTGILAVAAARSGASHVYAIESSSIAGAARANFKTNGLADRITLIEGWSTQIDLPERADVLISEVVGPEALGERVLEITLDARKRLLKPLARFVPNTIRILGFPVTAPKEKLNEFSFTTEAIENWRSWYEVDLGALADISRKHPPVIRVKPGTSSEWRFLGDPITLTEIDLASFTGTAIEAEVCGVVKDSGMLNGFLLFFEAELSPGNWLSTHPGVVSTDSHWSTLVQILPVPFQVIPGQRYLVNYQYRGNDGTFGWVTVQQTK